MYIRFQLDELQNILETKLVDVIYIMLDYEFLQ